MRDPGFKKQAEGGRCFFGSHEADSFWRWSDFLQRQAVAQGKEPVLINLDETAVSRSPHEAVGLVVSQRWWQDGESRPGQPINRQKLRGMVTHVGLCCPRSDVQGRLPQIFIGNYRCFTTAFVDAMSPRLPRNVQFWRRRSSWNSSDLMEDILREISDVMTAHFPNCQPIIIMDSAPIHLARAVVRRAAALGLW